MLRPHPAGRAATEAINEAGRDQELVAAGFLRRSLRDVFLPHPFAEPGRIALSATLGDCQRHDFTTREARAGSGRLHNRSRHLECKKEQLLVSSLNGLACSGLKLLLGATRPVAFRSVALFIVVMGASIGVHELVTARTLRGHLVDEWLLAAAGVVSVGFAGVFLGFALGWIRLEPSPSGQTFYWLGTYFGFGAVCLLGLAARQLRPPATIHRISDSALPAR